jgi:hypothetical protein
MAARQAVHPRIQLWFCSLALSAACWGSDAIRIQVTDLTLPGAPTNSLGFSSIESAINSLQGANPQDYFGPGYAVGDDVVGSIRVLGFELKAAMVGTTISYQFKDVNGRTVQRTFAGSTRDDALNQFEDFFRSKEAQQDLEKLLKAFNAGGSLSTATGPFSAMDLSLRTLVMSDLVGPAFSRNEKLFGRADGFQRAPEFHFALGNPAADYEGEFIAGEPPRREDAVEKTSSRSGFGAMPELGWFEREKIEGFSISLPLQFGLGFDKDRRVGLRLDAPFNWTSYSGADTFRLGLGAAVPIKIYGHEREAPLRVVVTPNFGTDLTASRDLFMAGLIGHLGCAARVEGDVWEGLTVGGGLLYDYYGSLPMHISGYDVDLQLRESVLCPGVSAHYTFAKDWAANLYFVHTQFLLENTVLSNYETIGLGVTYGLSPRSGAYQYVRVGLDTDLGSDYQAWRLRVGLGFNF